MTDRTPYRAFIDGLVEVSRLNVDADRIRAAGHAERSNTRDLLLSPEEQARKALLLSLPRDGREIVARMLEAERQAAVHDVLAHLDWAVAAERMDLGAGGVSFADAAEETFHFDFIARKAGEDWPGKG